MINLAIFSCSSSLTNCALIYACVAVKRVAKTVVFGGLLNANMAQDVHRQARECGTVSSITYPLPKEELHHHGKNISTTHSQFFFSCNIPPEQ